MSVVSTATLLLNGITIALSLGFLLIILWQDARKELNQFFAVFLFLVTLWNMGSLITLGMALIDPQSPFILFTISIMELGFTGSSIAVYALTAVLVGVHTRQFRLLAFLSLTVVLGYQIFLLLNNTPLPFEALGDGFYKYRFQPLAAAFYLMFGGTALYLIGLYRKKIKSKSLMIGLVIFITGQSLGFLNPELGIVSIATGLSSIAALIMSFALLRQEVIMPLSHRITQVEAVHKVSLAITSQLSITTVLDQIATQAANWINADGSGIFLTRDNELELVTVHNLPASYLHAKVKFGDGVAGTVADTHQTIHLENYGRDWKGMVDLPLARETFGSVISVPLIYGGESIGVLMVIAGKQGRLFQKGDVELLELLGAQAAVAIAHSHLFAEQQELTRQVEIAKSQLETVLTSTENPVVAVDRNLHLIFANPAARNLFPHHDLLIDTRPITTWLSPDLLPPNYIDAVRSLRRKRTYVYEITIEAKTYLCHLAQLGHSQTAGWVAVLNDITQLKELDRLKSEMVRMTSHDLKNPLQAAMANVELLNEDLINHPDSEIHQSLDNIQKQLLRMNRIIGGILDLERVKTGTLAMSLCSAKEILIPILDDLRHLADDQQIDLELSLNDDDVRFWADAEQVERAVVNLVENAIKFTHPGGRVIIQTTVEQSNIIFKVEDTGIGIPENLHSKIFDRFLRGGQRGQQGAEHVSGSGLGLSLVKAIAENHHGKIWLESQVGVGSTFYLSIPTTTATVVGK